MISDEAAEAAARVLHNGMEAWVWDEEKEHVRNHWRGRASQALEAAAPHMEDPRIDAIAAWCGRHRSGYYDEAQDDVMEIIRTNPYRSQA